MSRRTAIASTPAGGGSAVTMNYLWCGSRLCQARNASNAVARSYYTEGEFLPGTPAQSLYYGPDQIGSVRRVVASASSAPAFSYDPYGNALQSTAPLTDFNYAGMFFNADSGIYLTQYRAYNPAIGRWLSRDPLGERTDAYANLYAYVGGNPVSFVDRLGLIPDPLPPPPTPGNSGNECGPSDNNGGDNNGVDNGSPPPPTELEGGNGPAPPPTLLEGDSGSQPNSSGPAPDDPAQMADIRDWRDWGKIIYCIVCWKRFPDSPRPLPPAPPPIAGPPVAGQK